MANLVNHVFEDIEIGQTAEYRKRVAMNIEALNHAVRNIPEEQLRMHLCWGNYPGPHHRLLREIGRGAMGTVYLGQSLRFRRPVKIGDEITVKLEVIEKNRDRGFVTLKTTALNQEGQPVVTGSAEVMAPREKLSLARPELPEVRLS